MNTDIKNLACDFVSDRCQVLALLIKSKHDGLAIGINSRVMGGGTYITSVEDILLDEELMILLKPYDANGRMLNITTLKLSDIESVLPFSSKFENPFLKDIRRSSVA